MQINNNGITSNPNANTKQNTVEDASTHKSGATLDAASKDSDSVKLSPEAQALKELEVQIALSPEVDTKKVEQIRQEIEKGTYTINAETIASKILKSEDLL
jgi:negative regulator of flagellin synthesis FlgM